MLLPPRQFTRGLRLSSQVVAYSASSQQRELPRITVPQKMVLKLEKYKQRKFEKERLRRKQGPRGPLLISCKRKMYNFYQGGIFKPQDVSKLASFGWKSKKRNGDYFTLLPSSGNPSLQREEEAVSFHQLGLDQSLCDGLQEMGITSPTVVQANAIPSLLRGNSVICASETGSGKTLAYLLPTVNRILQQKKHFEGENQIELSPAPSVFSPRAVVLTPNRELTNQVTNVAKSLASYVDFIPFGTDSGHRLSIKDEPFDMLISTPGALLKLVWSKKIQGGNLQHLILDESDTLLDDSFISDIHDIFHKLQVTPAEGEIENSPFLSGTQLALVSATMPRRLEYSAGSILPVDEMQVITTEKLHHLMPHVPQRFIRLTMASKPENIIRLVKRSLGKRQATIVFANDNSTCYFVSKLLEENGVCALRISGELSKKARQGVFDKFKEGYSDVLVATDIASRGLDTTNVHHVINYDFPTFMSDYVHRIGRVGRVGVNHTCEVTSFVSTKWDVDLLWKIEVAARKGQQLDNVNANIKRTLEHRKAKHGPSVLFDLS